MSRAPYRLRSSPNSVNRIAAPFILRDQILAFTFVY